MSRILACTLAVSLLLAAAPARADSPFAPLLPRRETSTLDRALWLQRPAMVPTMGRAGGTALMVVGAIMVGTGWLVANTGLLIHSRAEEPHCPDDDDQCLSSGQKLGVGMMIGGAAVCVTGMPLLIYGAAERQRNAPSKRGPSRWGTGRLESPLAFSF